MSTICKRGFWILDLHLFWIEHYLPQAFLRDNSDFEVLFASAYMGLQHREGTLRTFPKSPVAEASG
jgi:hypothetical protein